MSHGLSNDDEFFEVVRAAVSAALEAAAERPVPMSVGAVLELYGSTMRLVAQVEPLQQLLESPCRSHFWSLKRKKKVRRNPENFYASFVEAEVAHVARFFEDVMDFSAALGKLDMAVMDIYQPGLTDALWGLRLAEGGAVDALKWYISETFEGDEPDELPPYVKHLLTHLGGEVAEALNWSFYGKEPWRYGQRLPPFVLHGGALFDPPDSIDSRRTVEVVGRMRVHLLAIREQLSAFVRANLPLLELTDVKLPSLDLGVNVGDKFERISDSTIVTRSHDIASSFNSAAGRSDPELEDALRVLGQVVEASRNLDAKDALDALVGELDKDEPRRSVLRALWVGLVGTLPAIGNLTDVVSKIEALFR